MHTVLATMDGRPLFLAQPDVQEESSKAETKKDANQDGDKDTGGGGLFDSPMFFILILGMMVLWIFLLGGGSRKQKKKQQEMLAAMSKGSKIVTIGGIKGSIVELREDEVVVKVDENNNTRMKFSKDAIRTVLDGGGKEPAVKDKDSKQEKDEK